MFVFFQFPQVWSMTGLRFQHSVCSFYTFSINSTTMVTAHEF
jgi:hypothetical protein